MGRWESGSTRVIGQPREEEDMSERDEVAALAVIQALVTARDVEFSHHAREEMEDEAITTDEVLAAIVAGRILENYPDDPRGPSCLLSGATAAGRPLHVVCTTAAPVLRIITVYRPRPPKWVSPTERRPR